MKISYSNKTLNAKPSGLELAKYFGKKGTSNRIQFKTVECQVEDIETIVANGHTLAYQYKEDNVMGDREKNYIGTDFIIIDIDSIDLTMDEVIDRASYKPTIIHTTFSNLTEKKNNKYCYHLIYCMDETLYGEENFNYAFSLFCSGIEELVDQNAKDCHRITFTSNRSLPNYQYKLLGNTYSTSTIINNSKYSETINGKEVRQAELSDLLDTKGGITNKYNKYNSSISYSSNSKSEFSVKKMNSSSIFYSSYNMKEEDKNLTNKKGYWGLDKKFISDLNKMKRKDFVCNYSAVYDYITFTPPTTTYTTEEGIVYADYRGMDFYELPSLWRTNEVAERERQKEEKKRDDAIAKANKEREEGRAKYVINEEGEITVEQEEQEAQPEKKEEIEVEEEPPAEEHRSRETYADKSVESSAEYKATSSTQTFKQLSKNKKYKSAVFEAISKMPDSPVKFNEKGKLAPVTTEEIENYLKSMKIPIDAIGTSDTDIQAWLHTLECR